MGRIDADKRGSKKIRVHPHNSRAKHPRPTFVLNHTIAYHKANFEIFEAFCFICVHPKNLKNLRPISN